MVVTGDRPTGRLHLGHWVGSLKQRIALQETCRCFFLVADLHALTTHPYPEDPAGIVQDWLSVGLDPDKSIFYQQSRIPEISELSVILSSLCTVPRVQRIPTLKEKAPDPNYSVGLLAYPILMSADILMFKGERVPVGEDQLSHVELARELARRFNHTYGECFPEPQAIVTPRLVGIDGLTKMSKSLGNAIYLPDDAATVEGKVRQMYTDPKRVRSDVPGTVEGNPVFVYHELFNEDRDEVRDLETRYRAGRVGDVEVKQKLARAINRFLDPIRERRARVTLEQAREILRDGTRKARGIAEENLSALLRLMQAASE